MKAMGVGLWKFALSRRRGRAPSGRCAGHRAARPGRRDGVRARRPGLAPLADAHRHDGDGRRRRTRLSSACGRFSLPTRWRAADGRTIAAGTPVEVLMERGRCARWRGPSGARSAAPTASAWSSCAARATTAATASSRLASCGAGECASTCSSSPPASTGPASDAPWRAPTASSTRCSAPDSAARSRVTRVGSPRRCPTPHGARRRGRHPVGGRWPHGCDRRCRGCGRRDRLLRGAEAGNPVRARAHARGRGDGRRHRDRRAGAESGVARGVVDEGDVARLVAAAPAGRAQVDRRR